LPDVRRYRRDAASRLECVSTNSADMRVCNMQRRIPAEPLNRLLAIRTYKRAGHNDRHLSLGLPSSVCVCENRNGKCRTLYDGVLLQFGVPVDLLNPLS